MLSPGDTLGPYTIVDLLGVGGMGEVYRATDARLNREVAIKVLPAEVGEDRLALERFRREAQIASRLQHPGIVSVVDVGESEGNHYYAMEYVKGPTLQSHFQEKAPLPPEEAA